MIIRNATYRDAPVIKLLLESLGYKASISLLITQLESQFGQNDHQVHVYELKKEVVGFISVHYLPQLAFDGGLAIITFLSVDDAAKDHCIAKALEQYVSDQARKRKCERIQVHCLEWRTGEHEFFKQQGYQEYPKYYSKRLAYAE